LEGAATVIMIAHRLSTIEHADAIYRLGGTARQINLADAHDS
jgi:ABC-type multidrug transport system fused ATPase/permease subunit